MDKHSPIRLIFGKSSIIRTVKKNGSLPLWNEIFKEVKNYLITRFYKEKNTEEKNRLSLLPLFALIDQIGMGLVLNHIQYMTYNRKNLKCFYYNNKLISNKTAVQYMYGYSKHYEVNYLHDTVSDIHQMLINLSDKITILSGFVDDYAKKVDTITNNINR